MTGARLTRGGVAGGAGGVGAAAGEPVVLWRGRLVELVPLQLVPLAALYDAAVATRVGIGWRPPPLRTLADLVASLPIGSVGTTTTDPRAWTAAAPLGTACGPGAARTGSAGPVGAQGPVGGRPPTGPLFGGLPRGATTAFAVGDARRAHLVGFVGLDRPVQTEAAHPSAADASLVAFFDLRHERTAALAADALVAMCRYAFAIVGVAGLRLALPPTTAGALRSAVERLDGLVHLGTAGGDEVYRVPAPTGPVLPPTPRAVPDPTVGPPGPVPGFEPAHHGLPRALPRAGLPLTAPPWPTWPDGPACPTVARPAAAAVAPPGSTLEVVVEVIRGAGGLATFGLDARLIDDLALDVIALLEILDALARRTGRAVALDAVVDADPPCRVTDLAALLDAAPRRRPWPVRVGHRRAPQPSPLPSPPRPSAQTGGP